MSSSESSQYTSRVVERRSTVEQRFPVGRTASPTPFFGQAEQARMSQALLSLPQLPTVLPDDHPDVCASLIRPFLDSPRSDWSLFSLLICDWTTGVAWLYEGARFYSAPPPAQQARLLERMSQ